MADRGAQAAVLDATQGVVEDFEHLPESEEGAFPEVFAQEVTDPAFLTDGAFTHSPEVDQDWGDQHTKHDGLGWYMTEPVTGLVALQGQAVGKATVAVDGPTMDLSLAGGSAGVATVSPAPVLSKAVSLAGQSNGTATVTSTLRNSKALAAAAAGAATAAATLRILGAYREEVLADAPYLFAHLDEAAGATAYNDPTLGGGAVADYASTYAHATTVGLVETERPGSMRGNDTFSHGRAQVIYGSIPPPSLDFSTEFWIRTARTDGQGLFGSGHSGGVFAETLLSGDLNANGTVTFSHAYSDSMGYVTVTSRSRVNDGVPHHIAVVHEWGTVGRSTLLVYIDGSLNASATATTTRTISDFGDWANTPSIYVKGGPSPTYIDEWSMYDYALTDTRIAEHYMAAWFDNRMVPDLASGQASVAGALSLAMAFSGASAGRASLGDPTKNQIIFDSLALPAGATYSTAPTFESRPDAGAGTTYVLRQADINDSQTTYTDIPYMQPAAGNLVVRYFIDSESGYDFARLFLDGVQFKADSGTPGSFRTATVAATAGAHTLRIQYSKDSSASSGIDNVDVSQIAYGVTGIELDIETLGVVVLAGASHGLATIVGALEISRPTLSGRIGATPIRRAFT